MNPELLPLAGGLVVLIAGAFAGGFFFGFALGASIARRAMVQHFRDWPAAMAKQAAAKAGPAAGGGMNYRAPQAEKPPVVL